MQTKTIVLASLFYELLKRRKKTRDATRGFWRKEAKTKRELTKKEKYVFVISSESRYRGRRTLV